MSRFILTRMHRKMFVMVKLKEKKRRTGKLFEVNINQEERKWFLKYIRKKLCEPERGYIYYPNIC